MRLPVSPLLACSAAVALAACGSLLNFDVDASGVAQIQGSPLGGLIQLPAAFAGFTDINLSQTSQFKNQDTRKDHISSVRVTRLALTVTAPASQDLSFLSSVAFSIEAPGLPKKRIAHLDAFPAGAHTINLALDDLDIAAYAKADTFSITTDASGHQPPQDTSLRADLTLHIEANLL